MARPREFDVKKALNDALELFWENGYEATTISDLASKMGINRPSLYAAFGGKRELFDMALNAYQHNYLNKLHDILEYNKSGYRGIEAVFIRFVESIRNPAAQRGCFFVNSIAELAALDEDIAAKGREFQEKVIDLFANALLNGKKHGDIPIDLDIEATSHFLTMSLVGLNVVIKTMPDENYIKNNVHIILSTIQ